MRLLSFALAISFLALSASTAASNPAPTTIASPTARGYAVYVTGEASITDGDVEKAREQAKAAAAREALIQTLEEELGVQVVERKKDQIQQLFLDPYQDFVTRSDLLSERRTGNSLFATFTVHPHITRIRTVITNSQLVQSTDRSRLTLIWAEESRGGPSGPENSSFPGYHTAAWSQHVTEPTVLPRLLEELTINELNVIPPDDETLSWAAETLEAREVDKAFLRTLGNRMDVDHVVFLRLIRRSAPTPPAAQMTVDRVNHVAFIFDVKAGDLLGEAITASLADLSRPISTDDHAQVPPEWLQQVVARLAQATAQPRTLVAVRGLTTVGEFDAMWRRLRQSPGLGDVAPSRMQANLVELELLGTRPVEDWARLMQRALPEARVDIQRGEISIQMPRTETPAPDTGGSDLSEESEAAR